MEAKYYESHVTIEPVFGERLELFAQVCSTYKFKAAKLLMQKDRADTPERSNKDTFCTGHANNYDDLHKRMTELRIALTALRFAVWRYKIEAVLLDVKCERTADEKAL